MGTINRFVLAVSFFIMGLILLPRLLTTSHYNVGHLALLAYLQGNSKAPTLLLQNVQQSFLRVQNASVFNPRVNWRLAFITYEQERFDEATDYFIEAQTLAPPDFLLSEQQSKFYRSYRYHQLQALSFVRNGFLTDALHSYHQALAAEPQHWPLELYIQYYNLLTQSDNLEMQFVGKRLSTYLNDLGMPLSTDAFEMHMTPFLPVLAGEDTNNCWQIERIRYDRRALEFGPLLPVQLEWRHVFDPSRNYTETRVVVNLAPNAGFEWGEQDGEPIGYPNTIYADDNPAQTRQLLPRSILSQTTTIAGLVNSAEHYSSSYVSNAISIEPDISYFQGGWVKSNDGRASLGHRWRVDLGEPERYQYVAADIHKDAWAFYGQVVTIPVKTEDIYLWLLNFNTKGASYFDDLLFFQIDHPNCSN